MKEETLHKVAKNLRVPLNAFDPPATSVPSEHKEIPFGRLSLMLRALDADRLSNILMTSAAEIRWTVNLQRVDEKARDLLEKFEQAVREFHQHRTIEPSQLEEESWHSLRFQLSGLKKGEDLAALMKHLAEHRITLFGADYLFWRRSSETGWLGSDLRRRRDTYTSFRIVLLSVEPHGAQSRRVEISLGDEPPKFAPKTFPPTDVFVGGTPLATEDGVLPENEVLDWKTGVDDDGFPIW